MQINTGVKIGVLDKLRIKIILVIHVEAQFVQIMPFLYRDTELFCEKADVLPGQSL